MNNYNVEKFLNEAKQNASSRVNNAQEVNLMMNMLNDPDFKVGVYKNGVGKVDELSIYETSRELVTSIISNGANINKEEARDLANQYNFSKNDASNMIGISKEFINTYLETGNKISLGAREHMNISLSMKHVDEKERIIPPGGLGNNTDKEKVVTTPAYNTVKVSGKNLY